MRIFQKIIGKVVSLLMIVVIIAIIFCVYCAFSIKVLHHRYVNLFGYSIFEVATGSMEKSINVGDAVLVKIDSDYKVGDVVTYQNGNDFITHRVVSIDDDFVVTKGDNNNVNDNPVDKKLVLGKVIKILPRVGVWKKVLLTPKIIVLIIATLFIFSILFAYDGKVIKIVSSKKEEEEIENKVNKEVNKKIASITRRKRRSKKVLEATQIIDVSKVKVAKDINKNEAKKKKNLDATQIIDISKIKEKEKKKKKLEATQIINVTEIKKKVG